MKVELLSLNALISNNGETTISLEKQSNQDNCLKNMEINNIKTFSKAKLNSF
jgi:hypothetical protein